MSKKIFLNIILHLTILLSYKNAFAQVSIVSAATNIYNITPIGLLQLNVTNFQNDIEVIVEAKILTAQNEPILDVVSTPFLLKKGMNVTSQLNLHIASTVYASSESANYIKTSHSLPSGKYHYCATIKSFPNDIITDEYCQDLESDVSSFLFLVSPPDKDEIETKYPVLIWTHSEPFTSNNNNPSDEYRMIVTDLFVSQSPEAAVNTNIPVYMKNFLTSHSVLYPIDAKELEAGKKYAWQVQKLNNGVIVNKTEAWEFKLKAPVVIKENKFVTVKKTLDGTYYKALNDKIFFRFDENYGGANINYKILNEKREVVSAVDGNSNQNVKIEAAQVGYNEFTIDLNKYNLKSGMYLLEITNDKKELYLLKFMAE